MADRSVVVRLRADISDFQRKMGEAAKGTKDAATGALAFVDKNAQSINTLSNGLGLVGAGMTGVAAIAVAKFADFDQAISNVKAATGESTANMALLRQAALDFGASTVYSATEAAGAIENLAKAGVSTKAILGGGLKGALDLAAAGQLDVADAAEFAASAMTQFNLEGADVPHIADLLAAGAGKAQGEVSDLGQALNQAGLVAAQTGLSIEETTGTLAAFASAGLLGSDAGTSFKTMLQRLSAPVGEAAGLMEELEISAYDANGQFVGMTDLAGQLTAAMGDMTPAARNAAMATIFGSDAVRAAAVVYENGAAGIESWIGQVDDSGYAAEQAAMRLDNLKGDWEAFTGALDTALIGMGEGANGPLRALVQEATGVVEAFGKMPTGVQQATLAIVGGGGLVLLGVAGMGKLAVATAESISAMKDLGIISDTTGSKVGGVAGKVGKWAAGIGLVTAGLVALDAATNQADMGSEELGSKLDKLSSSKDVVGDLFGDLVPKDSDLKRGEAFAGFLDDMANPGTWDRIGSNAGDFGVSITRVFGDDTAKWSELKDRLGAVGTQLSTLATSDLPAASEAFTALYEEAGGTQEAGENLLKTMPGLRDALIGIADGAGLATDDATLLKIILGDITPVTEDAAGAQDELEGSTSGANVEIKTQAELLTEVAEAHTTLMNIVLGERDAQRGFEEALDAASEALEKNGATLDITTEKGRANQAALDAIASSGVKLVEQMAVNGRSQEEIQGAVQRSRDEFLRMAGAMGMSAGDAEALANKLGLIPGDYTAEVIANTTQADTAVQTLFRKLDNKRFTVYVDAVTTGGGGARPALAQANGGVVDYFADGAENHVAQIASAGSWRVWAEPETGGEAYIPLASSKRGRSTSILENVADRFGYSLAPKFADGGLDNASRFAYTPPANPAPATARSFDPTGLQLVGTLDLGNGLEGRMEAVAVGVVDARDRSSSGSRSTRGREW
ncbi:phage tail tape measure protein [Oerskovia rustica]|uniref:Phage tail tape measure protein n=1 Tax=Oerskovia rustica TaxID=2762237 RepID=A0ABR8RP71_9CELL|nr:phage tail tape measure protein [Oerskovia rustica]MBD7949586.1 phage tail tape measure protein [Oerskovia rustica]